MALRKIRKDTEPILRKKSREVQEVDSKIEVLLDDMKETMEAANGIGLAAPQVGVLKRVIIVDIGNGLMEFINPVIVSEEGKDIAEEGCLSIPGKYEDVERPNKIKVKAMNRQGKKIELNAEGLLARVLCHEIDHLDGILFTDKIYKKF